MPAATEGAGRHNLGAMAEPQRSPDQEFAEWYVWAKREISTDNRVCHGAAQAAMEALADGAERPSAIQAARRSQAGQSLTLASRAPPLRRSYAEGYDWARREVGGDPERLHRATSAAIDSLQRGGGSAEAAAAARAAVPLAAPPAPPPVRYGGSSTAEPGAPPRRLRGLIDARTRLRSGLDSPGRTGRVRRDLRAGRGRGIPALRRLLAPAGRFRHRPRPRAVGLPGGVPADCGPARHRALLDERKRSHGRDHRPARLPGDPPGAHLALFRGSRKLCLASDRGQADDGPDGHRPLRRQAGILALHGPVLREDPFNPAHPDRLPAGRLHAAEASPPRPDRQHAGGQEARTSDGRGAAVQGRPRGAEGDRRRSPAGLRAASTGVGESARPTWTVDQTREKDPTPAPAAGPESSS